MGRRNLWTNHRWYAVPLALLLTACGAGARTSSPSVWTTPPATPEATAPGAAVLGVLGDWGRQGGEVGAVVRLMAGFASGRPLNAVVTTGDNAYEYGTVAEAAFARAAIAPLLRPGTRLVAALGNHDIATGGGRPVMAALGIPAPWYAVTVGPVDLVVLDANRPRDPAQLAFLRARLARPATRFRVVVFHQPAMSCSLHRPNAGVDAAWVPLFDRARVDLVLSGHNHTYERFRDAAGVPYVTTGGGGAALYPSDPGRCSGPGRMQYLRTVHHAVRLAVTAHRLVLEAIGLDGRTFDRLTLTR